MISFERLVDFYNHEIVYSWFLNAIVHSGSALVNYDAYHVIETSSQWSSRLIKEKRKVHLPLTIGPGGPGGPATPGSPEDPWCKNRRSRLAKKKTLYHNYDTWIYYKCWKKDELDNQSRGLTLTPRAPSRPGVPGCPASPYIVK